MYILTTVMLCLGTVVASAYFVGSEKSAIYHRRECEWAEKINPRNQVIFKTAEAAVSSGYRSCHVCFPPESAEVEKIWLSNPKLTLKTGKTHKLKWGYFPGNARDAGDIRITSSNPKVAVVSDGVLKAVGPGKCRITANCSKAKSVIEVEVERNYHIIALTGSMVFAMAMFALGFMLKTKRQK